MLSSQTLARFQRLKTRHLPTLTTRMLNQSQRRMRKKTRRMKKMTKPTMIVQEEIESGIDAHLLVLSAMARPTMEVKTTPIPRRNEVDHRRYIRLWKLASIHF
jgi:hypothetical protein